MKMWHVEKAAVGSGGYPRSCLLDQLVTYLHLGSSKHSTGSLSSVFILCELPNSRKVWRLEVSCSEPVGIPFICPEELPLQDSPTLWAGTCIHISLVTIGRCIPSSVAGPSRAAKGSTLTAVAPGNSSLGVCLMKETPLLYCVCMCSGMCAVTFHYAGFENCYCCILRLFST